MEKGRRKKDAVDDIEFNKQNWRRSSMQEENKSNQIVSDKKINKVKEGPDMIFNEARSKAPAY